MAKEKTLTNTHGPVIRARDPWPLQAAKCVSCSARKERARLAVLASIARFNKDEEIYRDGQRADAVFNIITGVVKAYKIAPDGSEHITAFLFPGDLFGLSEEGKYTNATKAITPLAVVPIPGICPQEPACKGRRPRIHVICKLIHELRETQRHAFLLARRAGPFQGGGCSFSCWKISRAARGERTAEIYLPMKRSDISEYLGMTLEAVSRAFRSLTSRGIIKSRDRRHLKITDRNTFDEIAGDTANSS